MSIFKSTIDFADVPVVPSCQEEQSAQVHQLQEQYQLRVEENELLHSKLEQQQLELVLCRQHGIELEEQNHILHTMVQQQQQLLTQKFDSS